MKYHIAVKFLAIFLCAACLLGAVGSGAGMVMLSELDLYNNTVEEVLEREIQSSARAYAREAALFYSSKELGGCPEELVSRRYWDQWNNQFYSAGDYGYIIRDAEGNLVAGSNAELAETGKCYSFPVSGQYMHLVSTTPKRSQDDIPQEPQSPLNGEYGVYDGLPDFGQVEVYDITVDGCTEEDGRGASSSGYGSMDPIGVLYHDPERTDKPVTFQCVEDPVNVTDIFSLPIIRHVTFRDVSGQVIYEVSDPEKINMEAWYGDGRYVFTPQDKNGKLTSVYLAEFYSMEDPNQTAFTVYGEDAIGEMHYDGSGSLIVNLQSILGDNVKVSGAVSGGWVSGICLYDGSGQLILEDRSTGMVTLTEDGMLYYHTIAAGTSAAPSQSEEPMPAAEKAAVQSLEPENAEPADNDGETPEDVPEEAPEEVPDEDGGDEDDGEDTQEAEDGDVPDEDGEDTSHEADAPEEEPLTEDGEDEPRPEEQPGDAEEEQPEATVPETQAPEVTEAPEVQETVVTAPEETAAAAAIPAPDFEEPVYINGKLLSDYEINTMDYYDGDTQTDMVAKFVYVPMPEYTVELYVVEGALRYGAAYTLMGIVRNFRSDLILILGVSLLLFAALAVYLCCAAGHKPKQEEVKAGGLCRMPIDLNLGISAAAFTGLAACGIYGVSHILEASIETGILAMAGIAYLVSLCIVQFLYCLAAQVKTPGGFWWRNSICGRLLMLCVKILKWMITFLPGKLVKFLIVLWNLGVKILRLLWLDVIVRAARGIGSLVRKFVSLLPLIWQWLLVGAVLVFLCAITAACGGLFLGILACLVVVLYVAYCFGVLMKSAKRMGKGDLNTKVDDKRLLGCFQEFAGDLNDLADVAVVAAQKQLKSERMKTELITNVSHDIKTPLTSIINYVDLLQKPHTEEEETMYLEVLARQSQRLKKLIEDLMDMSKASTGNMTVDIATLDAVEAVNQALGEFADKLDKAGIIPVFRHEEPSVMMRADGRLVWRVLSNLLGNAVKYAMPGTRLYLDLMEMEGNVILSLKNISRDELNVDSEELMERFVRGDDSRNTEGSGLGLNIAKSLMELQKGQLQLLVDGDLFKVTLIFPGA